MRYLTSLDARKVASPAACEKGVNDKGKTEEEEVEKSQGKNLC